MENVETEYDFWQILGSEIFSNFFRRKSLVDTPLPPRALSWAGNLQANLLVQDLPKKENKLPEYRLKKSTKQG